MVKVVETSNTEELFAKLVAIQQGANSSPYSWAFRGQYNADWKLVPKALRPGTLLGYDPKGRHYVSKGIGSQLDQHNGELVAARQFVGLADRVGLPLQGVHPFLRTNAFDTSDFGVAAVGGEVGTRDWPKPDVLPLLALAQHHGVPTRLLDFTFDPRVVAYFAVREAGKSSIDGIEHRFAIWCIYLPTVIRKSMDFSVVEVERAANPFLFAQRALFIIDRRLDDQPRESVSPSLDERIEKLSESENAVLKVTAPASAYAEVLSRLSCEGIDLPHLMPTYDNVVRHLEQLRKPNAN